MNSYSVKLELNVITIVAIFGTDSVTDADMYCEMLFINVSRYHRM